MATLRQAVILAGGLGERLRPLTNDRPKPLLLVQGKPILVHIFDILKKNKISEVYLSVGYLADQIIDFFDGRDFGLIVHFIVEKERAGTGGWMYLVDPAVFDADFIVLNGDNLMDVDFQEGLIIHKATEAMATIIARPIPVESFGGAEVLDIDEGGRVLGYIDRQLALGYLRRKEEAIVSSGYYIFSKDVFQLLPRKMPMSNEKDLFPLLAENGQLSAYISRALWFDTGTFERLKDVETKWKPSMK